MKNHNAKASQIFNAKAAVSETLEQQISYCKDSIEWTRKNYGDEDGKLTDTGESMVLVECLKIDIFEYLLKQVENA